MNDLNVSLSEALAFTPAELSANRKGQLSPQQGKCLQQWASAARKRAYIVNLCAILAASLSIFMGIRQDITPLIWLGIAIALINAYFTGLALRYQWRIKSNLSEECPVYSLEGEVSRIIHPIGRLHLRSIRVANRNLPVTDRTFTAFQHQKPYRLYLTRLTDYLLAAERLSD